MAYEVAADLLARVEVQVQALALSPLLSQELFVVVVGVTRMDRDDQAVAEGGYSSYSVLA
jgi:hypothetical protein